MEVGTWYGLTVIAAPPALPLPLANMPENSGEHRPNPIACSGHVHIVCYNRVIGLWLRQLTWD
jgi:hypothetical protein